MNNATETVITTARTRRASVSNATIIEAWQRISLQEDENGVKTGSIQQVADECGMQKTSLSQRINKIRKELASLEVAEGDVRPSLNPMPRAKGGGRPKSVSRLRELLAEVNEKLGVTPSNESDADFDGNPEAVETFEVAEEEFDQVGTNS